MEFCVCDREDGKYQICNRIVDNYTYDLDELFIKTIAIINESIKNYI